MNFILSPYYEVGPLRFGMSEDEVVRAVGKAERVLVNRKGEPDHQYSDFSIRFSANELRLVEVGFHPSTSLCIDTVDVFHDPKALDKLMKADKDVFEYYGFIIFLNLGLTLTGFHDEEECQKAATCFIRGRWNHLKPNMRPFKWAS